MSVILYLKMSGDQIACEPCGVASELPSMIATLNSYESMFGPYHFQTLALTAQIGRFLWSAKEARNARLLLEYSVTHLARDGDYANAVRLQALVALRDLLVDHADAEKAAAVQKEIVECRVRLSGPEDQELAGARVDLARMLMSTAHRGAAA